MASSFFISTIASQRVAARRFIQLITGQRLATILAVLCDTVFQCLNPFYENMEKRNHSFPSLIVCFPDFFIRWQVRLSHTLISI
jgi:hypothetical protein